MIWASLLAGCSVGLFLFLAYKYFGPSSVKDREQKVKSRIFEDTSAGPAVKTTLEKNTRMSEFRLFNEFLHKHNFAEKISLYLKRAGLMLSVSVFLLSCLVMGLLSFFILELFTSRLPALLLGCVIGTAPVFYLRFQNNRYIWKFTEYLPDALSIISNSIKVGQSLDTAIAAVTRTNLKPVSNEFRTVVGEIKLGQSLQVALQHLYERIPVPEVRIFVTGVTIHQETGGNLAEILETLEKTTRDRFAIEREIRALAAQGIMSVRVLIAVPFVVCAIWMWVDPELLPKFIESDLGRGAMMYCVIAIMLAYIWMKNLVKLKD